LAWNITEEIKITTKEEKPSSDDKSYNYALLVLHSFQSGTCKDEEISSNPPKVLNLKEISAYLK
jgi:hypothetical protein